MLQGLFFVKIGIFSIFENPNETKNL